MNFRNKNFVNWNRNSDAAHCKIFRISERFHWGKKNLDIKFSLNTKIKQTEKSSEIEQKVQIKFKRPSKNIHLVTYSIDYCPFKFSNIFHFSEQQKLGIASVSVGPIRNRYQYHYIQNAPRVRSHAPSIQSHRGTKVVWPDFQPMRVPEELVCIDIFRKNPVFTSLLLKISRSCPPPQYEKVLTRRIAECRIAIHTGQGMKRAIIAQLAPILSGKRGGSSRAGKRGSGTSHLQLFASFVVHCSSSACHHPGPDWRESRQCCWTKKQGKKITYICKDSSRFVCSDRAMLRAVKNRNNSSLHTKVVEIERKNLRYEQQWQFQPGSLHYCHTMRKVIDLFKEN